MKVKYIYIIESGLVDGLKAFSTFSKAFNYIVNRLDKDEIKSLPQFSKLKKDLKNDGACSFDFMPHWEVTIHKKLIN